MESQKNHRLDETIYIFKPGKDQGLEGENKMAYNAKDSKEMEGVPAGVSAEGVIINIKDGKSRDFIKTDEARKSWKGDLDQTAIEVEIETKFKERSFKLSKMFTYTEEDGKTVFGTNSNLGKYNSYYGKLPEVGDKVKLLSNKDGFFRLLIE